MLKLNSDVHEKEAVQNDSHYPLPRNLHIKRCKKEVLWATTGLSTTQHACGACGLMDGRLA
jgi:hypothetical protein